MKKWSAVPLVAACLVAFSNLVSADTFRLGVLPDTQKTIEEAPEVFLSQIDWIVANRNDPNNPIVYVATLGDMKDDNNCDVKNVVNPETGVTMSEWEILDYGYDELDAQVPRVPYGVVPGNHDYDPISTACFIGDPNDDTNRRLPGYNQLFGPDRFNQGKLATARGGVREAWYGGPEVAGDNEDNYTLFSSHGIDFISINLGYRNVAYPQEPDRSPGVNDCAPPGNPKQLHDAASHNDSLCDLRGGDGLDLHNTELHWADDLLDQFSNRLAIITAHYIMDGNRDRSSGNFRTPSFGPYAQQMFDYLGGHQNLFMMLGAHERGEAWIINPRTGMQPVHGLLSNYQDLDFPTGDVTQAASFQNLPEHNGGIRHPDSFTPTPRHGDLTFSGFMRMMTFDTETGLVDIQTLAPAMTVLAPGETTPPAGRDVTVVSARSTNAATNSNNPASLTLTHRTATNINDISFVGYVNLPPTATGVAIVDNDGGSADVGDTLTGNYSFNDLDGDADNSSFRWLRDGLAIDGATGRSYTLAAADAGQPVSFEVTPAANAGPGGVPVESAAVSVTAAPQGLPPFVQTGSLANDIFLRFLAGANIPAAEVNDRCADGDGCRITLTRVYGGTTTVFGPCNFSNNPAANQFQLLSTNCSVIGTGINANSGTETIFGVASNTNCRFSDWDTSGNGGNGDQNANFSVLISNSTATNLTCTFRIDD